MKRFFPFLLFPLVAFGEYDDTLLRNQLEAIYSRIASIEANIIDPAQGGSISRIIQNQGVLKEYQSLMKAYLYDILEKLQLDIGPDLGWVKVAFKNWWNEGAANIVTNSSEQLYYFLKDVNDPYELNEYHVWRLNSDPGDMSPLREFEPYVREHNFSTTFKDYFEDYSNNHLEILSYNNKLLADIAMSLAPTGKQYRVSLPYFGHVGSVVDYGYDWWEYFVNFGRWPALEDIVQITGPGSVQDEYFDDPNEAILAVLSQSFDLQSSFTLPLVVMITNQQAIISRLTHADTSFTNELAATVSEDTADPGKYDTQLDGVISSLNIEESSFFSGFKESFSAPSSAELSFEMPRSVGIYLGEFLDFHLPMIDIDTSGYSRFFAILRKCMIAFWGVVSFAFWASVFKLFVLVTAKFAMFFGPQVSDGLGKS